MQEIPTKVLETLKMLAGNEEYENLLSFAAGQLPLYPQSSELFFYQAEALRNLERLDEALQSYQDAILMDPNNALARSGYALAHYEKGNVVEALTAADSAILLEPEFPDPYLTAADILENIGFPEQAVFPYERAYKMIPDNYALGRHTANLFALSEEVNDCLDLLFSMLERFPNSQRLHLQTGISMLYLLSAGAKRKDLEEYVRIWQGNFPKNRIAHQIGDAVRFNDIHFDVFTPDNLMEYFDEEEQDLTDENTVVPLVIEKLEELYPSNSGISVLELGCKDGAYGKIFRQYANLGQLVAVDISRKMLDRAYDKRIYDKVYNADFISYLSQNNNEQYDLVFSSGALSYNKNLNQSFELIHQVLKNDGKFVFIIRHNEINNDDSVTLPSFECLYNKNYISSALKRAGFDIKSIEDISEKIEWNQENRLFLYTAVKK